MKYIFALILIVYSSIAQAQNMFCVNSEDMKNALAKGNQVLVSNGMVSIKNGMALLQTYVNPKTRTFTIILTYDSTSCLVIGGADYTEFFVDANQPIDF